MNLEILSCLPKGRRQRVPLLFLHGAFHGAWCWQENFLPYFSAQGFPSYALSFRGHGKSEGREELNTFTLEDYLEDTLQAIGLIGGKPVLIGHSMGGAVAQMLIGSHQDKIAGVVLLAAIPPHGMLKDMFRLCFTKFRSVMRLALFNEGKAESFPTELLFSEGLPVEKKEEFAKLSQPESRKARNQFMKRIVTRRFNGEVPVLVLGGEKDCFLSPRALSATGRMYKTEAVILSGISHDMMLDPAWRSAADEILRFISLPTIQGKKIKGGDER